MTQADLEFMAKAIKLAKKGLNTATPNPRVGCVIVDAQGEIIGEGYHVCAGDAHAEVNALNQAGVKAEGACVYVTLEPCSHTGETGPCAEALIKAKVGKVVYAMEDPNPKVAGRGIEWLIEEGIEVAGPLLEEQAIDLNPGFIKRMRRGLPYVRCKMAMSIDGRTAMASGESKWITGPAAREDVQRLRARSCAIVTGVGTVIHDEPAMTVRIPGSERQPLRVVVDTHNRSSENSEILDQKGTTIIACSENTALEQSEKKIFWPLPEKNGRVNLLRLLMKMADEGCNEVLVEAGAELSGAFLAAGLVDEIIIYMAPKLLGSSARPLFNLPIKTMAGQLSLSIKDIRSVGCDWRITAIPDPDA